MRKVLLGFSLGLLLVFCLTGTASAHSPSAARVVSRNAAPVTIFADDFEGGQRWDSSSSGWTVTTDEAYSPSHSAHAPEFGSPLLVYGPFDLSQATAATLSFELWYDAPTLTDPPSSTTCGAFLIGYSTDGSTFTFPTQWSGSTGGTWQQEQVDLSSWYDQASQTTLSLLGDSQVWIALSSSVTSATFASSTEGSYVDSVALTAAIEDATPPVTSVVGLPGAWTNQPVTLSFAATDNAGGTGVAYTEYSINGGKQWTTGTSLVVAAPADHTGDGIHTILYRSVDNAGNQETARSCRVKIDTRRPTTRAPHAAYVARGHTAHLKYAVSDSRPGSPTADVTIEINNSAGTLMKTLTRKAAPLNKALIASFKVPRTWRPGAYRFLVFATDQAGNKQTLPVGSNKLNVRLTNAELAAILAARLKRHTGNLAVGAIDRTSGARVVCGGGRFHTASIIKADILATLLLQHQATGHALTGARQALARRMIEDSDNNAATALWNEVGGASGVARANVRLGLSHTTPSVYWGLTGTTAADQLTLLSDLVSSHSPLSATSRSYELGLMRHVASDQAWGVTAAATPGTSSAVKNGWLPDPYFWVINSIGVIHHSGHVLLVAVLSNDQPTEAVGIAQDESAAVAAVHVATAVNP